MDLPLLVGIFPKSLLFRPRSLLVDDRVGFLSLLTVPKGGNIR